MIKFEWRYFGPAGGDFIASSPGGHLLAFFMTGEEAWGRAMESRQPRHAECYRTIPMVGFIDEISVKKDSRKKGVGSALLVAALEKFKELGVRHVYLRAVPERPEWLLDLLRFYWRYGFDIAKDCIDAGDAAITMRAVLE